MNTDTNHDISPLIKEKAPLILAEIEKAKSVLLHCHPSPDPDSVGSALAMKFALEQLGKKVTVIKGDSEIPQAFMHFPGADEIVMKNYFEIDLKEFDLFVVQDTADLKRISYKGVIEFPPHLLVVNIDHHKTNPEFGAINLIESQYPATAQILYDLFTEWRIKLTQNIAANLFIGIYTDTGGFKYRGATSRTFYIASQLAQVVPSIPDLVTRMENSNTPAFLRFEAAALNSIEVSSSGKFAMASVSWNVLKEKNIPITEIRGSEISSFLLTVAEWDIVASAVETEPNRVKFSFRSRDGEKNDVSRVAVALGGGGHKMAAGATVELEFDDAKKSVVERIKEMYNL